MMLIVKYNELVAQEATQMQKELAELTSWLHSSRADRYFDPKEHIHLDAETGDHWIFTAELSESQQFAVALILSSSDVELEGRPLRRGPTGAVSA